MPRRIITIATLKEKLRASCSEVDILELLDLLNFDILAIV